MWRGEVLKCVAAWLVVIAPSVTARTMARFFEYDMLGECLMVCVWEPNPHKEMDQNDYCGETRSGR